MEYDKNRYKNLSSPWKHFFWFISPLSVFFDILGIRIPKITLEKLIPDTPFIERRYTPCPHCNTLHDSRIWLQKNIFANWFGLYCPTCGNIIPCQTNAVSGFILFITYPLWGWSKDRLRVAWLRKQPDRYRNLTFDYFSKTRFRIQSGVCFVLCYITVQVFFKILSKEDINGYEVRGWIFTGVFSSLVFVYYMSYFLYKKINHEKEI